MKRLNYLLLGLLVLMLIGCDAMPGGTPARIQLDWTTATEINTAGFNLYRGESAQGPFVKINDQLIAASSDPVVGGKYHYEDAAVQAGKTYYYQLEDVEMSGVATKHSPVSATAAGSIDLLSIMLMIGVVAVVIGVGAWRIRARPAKETTP